MNVKRCLVAAAGLLAGTAWADPAPAEIRLRDADLEGLMGVKSGLSLVATFDVKRENLYDELVLDFYLLLEPRDKNLTPQFFHCRTVHRFLEEETGYTSGVGLSPAVMECIQPRSGRYAVIATYRGAEVGVENSEKERWWEGEQLGRPIENVLTRSTGASVVRTWESDE